MPTVTKCSACGKPVPPAEAAAYHGRHEDCWSMSVEEGRGGPLAHKTDRRRKAPPLEPGAGLASRYSGVPVADLEGLQQITNQNLRVIRRKH
jgi:recombinational DNA repair protein (RecF pathway)